MGMLIARVEVRDLKADYIYKLWGSLASALHGGVEGL